VHVLSLIGVDAGRVSTSAVQSAGRLVAVLVVAAVILAIVRRLINRIDDVRLREQVLFFVPKLVGVVVALCALAAVGIDVSGMAAIMATVGFTGAVVFTPVGQNLVAGAMIRIDDLYQVDEVVTVGELHGTVVYRSMLRTELELPDGSKAWVPNSAFQDSQVLNHSRMGGWRICVQVPLDRFNDRALAHRVMSHVMEHLSWNAPGKRAFIAFDHVGAEALFFNAYAWIDDRTEEPWYRGLLLSQLVDELEDAGVSVGQTTNLAIRASDDGPVTGEIPVMAGARPPVDDPQQQTETQPDSGIEP
jgi:small conductance mechanosensitive channel